MGLKTIFSIIFQLKGIWKLELSLLGTTYAIINTLKELNLINWKLHLFPSDNLHKDLLNQYANNKQIDILYDQRHIEVFLKNASNLIIDSTDKIQLYKLIKQWSRFHDEGMLVIRNSFKIGLGDRIDHWLKRKGKVIEVVVFPSLIEGIKDSKEIQNLILGGNPHGKYTKQFRKKLADHRTSIFITTTKEAELINLAIHSFYYLTEAYWMELEQLHERLQFDMGVIRKGLIQHISLLKHSLNIPDYLLDDDLKFIRLAKEIMNEDQFWLMKQIKDLIKKESLKRIAVWGIDREETVKELLSLPIEKIRLYMKKEKRKYISSKLEYISDFYLAAKNAEALIILHNEAEYSAVSLTYLEQMMAKKIMIDQVHLFEKDEMDALQWVYISKGQKNKYKTERLRE